MQRPQIRRRAFSLLEVILALSILTGAVLVIGEMIRSGSRNAQRAREMTQAQLICESRLAEVTAGLVAPDPVNNILIETESQRWFYSLSHDPISQEGLLAIRVTVVHDQPNVRRPVECSLVRWMRDPNAPVPEAVVPSADSSGSSSGGSSGSGSSTGGGSR